MDLHSCTTTHAVLILPLLETIFDNYIDTMLSLNTTLASSAESTADDGKPTVRLETTMGSIDIELYPDRAPETVANFLDLVDNGFYDGLIFHRQFDTELANFQQLFSTLADLLISTETKL